MRQIEKINLEIENISRDLRDLKSLVVSIRNDVWFLEHPVKFKFNEEVYWIDRKENGEIDKEKVIYKGVSKVETLLVDTFSRFVYIEYHGRIIEVDEEYLESVCDYKY